MSVVCLRVVGLYLSVGVRFESDLSNLTRRRVNNLCCSFSPYDSSRVDRLISCIIPMPKSSKARTGRVRDRSLFRLLPLPTLREGELAGTPALVTRRKPTDHEIPPYSNIPRVLRRGDGTTPFEKLYTHAIKQSSPDRVMRE
jgi:hypothetical protein